MAQRILFVIAVLCARGAAVLAGCFKYWLGVCVW